MGPVDSTEQRYLIVSLGSIGRRHLRNLRALRPASTIAVLRLQAAASADDTGCDLQLQSMEQVRSFGPQAAIIAAPASVHVAVAAELAGMGIPLLIEKPFSTSMDGLGDLIATCASGALTLMIGYNLRFKRSLLEARRRVLAGDIGRVLSVRAEVGQYLPDWRPDSDYRRSVSAQAGLGGGALLELSHEIDYLYWFFGMPQHVSCRGGRYSDLEIEVEDTVELCLEYEEPRKIVSVHLDFVARHAARTCKLVGTHGTLLWDGIADRIDLTVAGKSGTHSELLPMADANAPYVAELSHFLDCVGNGSTPAIDGIQGYDVMAIVTAARTSMNNRTVERPIPYGSR